MVFFFLLHPSSLTFSYCRPSARSADTVDLGASSAGFTLEFWVNRASQTDGPVVRWYNPAIGDRVQYPGKKE